MHKTANQARSRQGIKKRKVRILRCTLTGAHACAHAHILHIVRLRIGSSSLHRENELALRVRKISLKALEEGSGGLPNLRQPALRKLPPESRHGA